MTRVLRAGLVDHVARAMYERSRERWPDMPAWETAKAEPWRSDVCSEHWTDEAEAAVLAVLTAIAAWSRSEGCSLANPDPEFFEEGLVGFARTHGFEPVYIQAVSGVWKIVGFGPAS